MPGESCRRRCSTLACMDAGYARRHRHFLAGEVPPLLGEIARPALIADVGCGDGAILQALRDADIALAGSFAIDRSETRVSRAEGIGGIRGILADATDIPLGEASVDAVVCSQVIEHVPDQRALVSEIARILKPGGWWYIGSCLRTKRGWWIYRREGRTWLDPTHVREYQSVREFRDAITHPHLSLEETRLERFMFPLLDLGLRMLHRDGKFYVRHPRLITARAVRIPPPGYWRIEAAGRRLEPA